LRFTASLRLMDFDRDDVDVAIRFGLPREEPGLSMHVLSREWVTPMMTPEMAQTYASRRPREGAAAVIEDDLDFLKPAADWSAWFRAAGLPPRFSAGARVQPGRPRAGCRGRRRGVVLGRITLAERDLREGGS
jgi:LysR family glycine cleavage system transcriptional activator